MTTTIKPRVELKKYGTRAYHVMIDGEHWGNVCGYEPRTGINILWTAAWFLRSGQPLLLADKIDNRGTRSEAIQEVVINTAPARRYQ